jgi:hypothetical protein
MSSSVFSEMGHHKVRILVNLIRVLRRKTCLCCEWELSHTIVEFLRRGWVWLLDRLWCRDFSWDRCTHWVAGIRNDRGVLVILSLLVLAWSVVNKWDNVVVLLLVTLHAKFRGYSWGWRVWSFKFLRNSFGNWRISVRLRSDWSMMLRFLRSLVKKDFLLWLWSVVRLRTYCVKLRWGTSMFWLSFFFSVMVDCSTSTR